MELRRILWVMAIGILAGCSRPADSPRKLVVLAVEGLDPQVIASLVATGRVPHLTGLVQRSGLVRVTSTPGAESASAWASFATGTTPGDHGVFDAIVPDSRTAHPRSATLQARASATWPGGAWREGAAYAAVRDGEPFWAALGRSGVRTTSLFVPGTFPPIDAPLSTIIGGTPLPDWGGGWGAGYTWLASDVPAEAVGFTRYGGRLERLTFTRSGDGPALVASATLVGLRAPERVDVPLSVTWNPENRSANLAIGDETVFLNEGQQSRWLTITVSLGRLTRIQGLVRARLVRAGNDVQVYVSPIQWHPAAPPSPIASPAGAAATLLARIGSFRTASWPDAAWAFADGWVDHTVLAADDAEAFEDRSAALLSEAGTGDWNLLMAGIESIDVRSRLTAPIGVPGEGGEHARVDERIARVYERLDRLIGDLRSRIPSEADLVVFSPHGVSRVRQVVDLNRWLTREGWLVWREPPPPVTLAAMADGSVWPDLVDWTRTAARAMGAGHIYLSVRGRDPHGVVDPGADYDELVAAIRQRLEGLTDPANGRRVIARVRPGREAYSGRHIGRAPDLVVTFAAGYGGSWDSTLGGLAADVIGPNLERWAAGHAGVDERFVPGVWLSSFPVTTETMSVYDVAPAIQGVFGVPAVPTSDRADQARAIASNTSRR